MTSWSYVEVGETNRIYQSMPPPHPLAGHPWENSKPDTETARRADEVEFRALKEGSSSLNEALRDDRMDGNLLEMEDENSDEIYRQSIVEDDVIADVSRELERRAQLLKDAWPFELQAGGLILDAREPSKSLVYELCLAIARSPSLTKGDFKNLPSNFERVALRVLLTWLGGNSNGIRTGWPREPGLPTDGKELFEIVCKAAGGLEWNWSPDLGLSPDPSHKHFKECKLDLLAWLQMPDEYGHVYFAGQCACGFNNMEDKARELTVAGLRQWVKPPSFVELVRCFFVPFHLPPQRLREIMILGGATFDRARLAMIAEGLPAAEAEKLKKQLQPAVELVTLA